MLCTIFVDKCSELIVTKYLVLSIIQEIITSFERINKHAG